MNTKVKGSVSRLTGRLLIFVWAALLLGATGAKAAPVKTLIQDTLYRADGSAAHGTVSLRWSGFSTSAGEAVAAGEMTVVTDANGGISISLIPNTGSAPSGSYYRVVIKLDDGTTSEEQWVVPATASTTVAAIRSNVVPQAVATQFVSRDYVDSALGTLTANPVVHLSGTESIGGTKTFVLSPEAPAPTDAGGVANKGYVDHANTSGNAATATALAGAPAQCNAGQYSTGVNASGVANCAAVAYSQIAGPPPIPNLVSPGAIGATTPSTGAFTNVTASGSVAVGTTCPAWAPAGSVCSNGKVLTPVSLDGYASMGSVKKKLNALASNTVYAAGAVTYALGTYTAAPGAQPIPLALSRGQVYFVNFPLVNLGAANLMVGTLPAKSLTVLNSEGTALTLAGGEIVPGPATVYYDGIEFIYSSPGSQSIKTVSAKTLTQANFANRDTFFLASGAQTVTLPCSSSLSPNGQVFVFSYSGAVTFATTGGCTPADSIGENGSFTATQISQQGEALNLIVTDAAGHFYISGGMAAAGIATNAAAIAAIFPKVVAKVSLTGQTSSISATTIYTTTVAGTYRLSIAAYTAVAGTAGTLTGQASAGGQASFPSINLNAGGYSSAASTVVHVISGWGMQYATTVSGATGSPQYGLDITVEQLQ